MNPVNSGFRASHIGGRSNVRFVPSFKDAEKLEIYQDHDKAGVSWIEDAPVQEVTIL